ncbi:helix-turn-helix domain-containing protein [Bombella sp. ESL0387]|nr:helix-turn-helix domain-containing protein [Bombella sp. ESL0387]
MLGNLDGKSSGEYAHGTYPLPRIIHMNKTPSSENSDNEPPLTVRLREFREAMGLSRADLAENLGISSTTLYRWENGSAKPSPLAAKRLTDLGFGIVPTHETNVGSVPRLKLKRLEDANGQIGLDIIPHTSEESIITAKINGCAVAVNPSPFVQNGPSDQTSFHRKLIDLQFQSNPDIPIETMAKRLSLVHELSGYQSTAQYELERPKPKAMHWNSNYGSHGWHRYVGRFPPHVVRALLNHFGTHSNSLVCDPFVGSGTTAVECRLLGIPFVGIEICPLSCLITRTKSQFPENADIIGTTADSFSYFYAEKVKCILQGRSISTFTHQDTLNRAGNLIPAFANLERWFTSEAFLGVSITMEFAMSLEGYARDAVLLALSSRMRSIGNVDVDVVRAEYSSTPRENVNVGNLVTKQLRKMQSGVIASLNTHSGLIGHPSVIDIKEGSVLDVDLPDGSVDCVITSPPYGIEALSYLRTHLLSYRSLVSYLKHDPYETRDKTIGSEYLENISPRGTPLASEVSAACKSFFNTKHNDIGSKYLTRRAGMIQFFDDMLATGVKISRWLKPGGKVAFIIGNKRLGEDIIPTDIIIRELFESCGLRFVDQIQHKLKTNNSNSQVPWQEKIIQEESILIFDKVRRYV